MHILLLHQFTSIWETLPSFSLMLGSLMALPDLYVGDYLDFSPLLSMTKFLCMNSSSVRTYIQYSFCHCHMRLPWNCKFWKLGSWIYTGISLCQMFGFGLGNLDSIQPKVSMTSCTLTFQSFNLVSGDGRAGVL